MATTHTIAARAAAQPRVDVQPRVDAPTRGFAFVDVPGAVSP